MEDFDDHNLFWKLVYMIWVNVETIAVEVEEVQIKENETRNKYHTEIVICFLSCPLMSRSCWHTKTQQKISGFKMQQQPSV